MLCIYTVHNDSEEVALANNKSAEKRIRSSKKRTQLNKRLLTYLKKCEKLFHQNVKSKNTQALPGNLNKLFSLADKVRAKGIIKKNTVNRKKARFSEKLSKILA